MMILLNMVKIKLKKSSARLEKHVNKQRKRSQKRTTST